MFLLLLPGRFPRVGRAVGGEYSKQDETRNASESKMFTHVVCVNLDRRTDRWDRFRLDKRMDSIVRAGCFSQPLHCPAIDSRKAKPPQWFTDCCPHPGAWGCLRTHVRIWEDALSNEWDSVLVFEDDAIFRDDFVYEFQLFMENVSADWDQIYLGGQHLYVAEAAGNQHHHGSLPPQFVNEHVLRCQNVNRTHAYAMRPSMMQAALDKCSLLPQGIPSASAYHVDHRLGELHGDHKVYSPTRWIVGQEHGQSDVKGTRRDFKQKWWNEFPIRDAETVEAVA